MSCSPLSEEIDSSRSNVSRVSVDLTLDDGRTIRASSPVQGQVAVSDPWRGVIPNQVGDVGP